MALTDNAFTLEELEAAVAANPGLLDTVKSGIDKLGLKQSIVDETTKGIYDNLDKDIAETSGVARDNNEKTFAYAKRVIGNLKGATGPLQQEIDRLTKTIADGNGDATMKAQLEKLQTEQQDWQKKEKDYDTKLFQADVRSDVRLGLAGLKFNEALPKSLVKLAVDNAERTIVGMATVQKAGDQSTLVYMEDGKVKLGKDNQPATAADLLKEQLKEVLDEGPGGAGGGGQGNPPAPKLDGQGNPIVPDTLPADVKTQGQYLDYLVKLGFKRNTTEFDKAYGKHADKLLLR